MDKIHWLLGALTALFIGLIIFILVLLLSTENLTVTINDGTIRGIKSEDYKKEVFYSFLGIPYAKPPVGNLRFKAAQPIEPWNGIKDATQFVTKCPQIEMTGELWTNEDCLYLNVFTKSLPQETSNLKPVMIYIHSGQYLQGSSKKGNPAYLITEDIVLVTINYRLGLLGFLNLQDPSLDVPGNNGLKGQILAFKWVQNNIKYFNGDSNKVTIFGDSAGGSSVSFQLVSSASKNLYHGAISQSGSVANPWAVTNFDVDVIGFCEYLGTNATYTERECLEYLMKVPAVDLVKAQMSFLQNETLSIIGPVIEYPNNNSFITKHPMDIINSGEQNMVPTIFGYDKNEGLLFNIMLDVLKMNETHKYRRNAIVKKILEEKNVNNTDLYLPFEKNLPFETDFNNETQLRPVLEKLLDYYVVGKNINRKIMLNTDAMFAIGIITTAYHTAKTSTYPVFLYRFSLSTNLYLTNRFGSKSYKNGVSHNDESPYLFKRSLDKKLLGMKEKDGIRTMIKLWTNFAKYGNPTPNVHELNVKWKPIQKKLPYFLDIDELLRLKTNPEKERFELWKEVFSMNPQTLRYL